MTRPTPICDYNKEPFSFPMRNGVTATHDVYIRGTGKKVLVLIQELPGIGPETLVLADRFVKRKYTVVIPHLFGPLGKKAVASNLYSVFCMRKEFYLFASNQSSPIVDFLGHLCAQMKERYQVNGVATIGMCLTGNFALALMANDAVLASYASQPAMPFHNPWGLHLSEEEIAKIKSKLDEVGPMHCGRFKNDMLSPKVKHNAIKNTFNTAEKERVIFHEIPGFGHSILTVHFGKRPNKSPNPPEVLEKVMTYFDGQLT